MGENSKKFVPVYVVIKDHFMLYLFNNIYRFQWTSYMVITNIINNDEDDPQADLEIYDSWSYTDEWVLSHNYR